MKKLVATEAKVSGPFSTEDIRQAEETLIISAQTSVKSSPKYTLWRQHLGLFFDEKGIIRCRGRIGNTDLPYNAKNPAVLPQGHLRKLLVSNLPLAAWRQWS